jgi:hypothetical protein
MRGTHGRCAQVAARPADFTIPSSRALCAGPMDAAHKSRHDLQISQSRHPALHARDPWMLRASRGTTCDFHNPVIPRFMRGTHVCCAQVAARPADFTIPSSRASCAGPMDAASKSRHDVRFSQPRHPALYARDPWMLRTSQVVPTSSWST